MKLDEFFARFSTLLPESAWWVSLFKTTLTAWGRYALAHPTGTIVCAVVFVAIVLIARFVLKAMWRVICFVFLPAVIVFWFYGHVIQPLW